MHRDRDFEIFSRVAAQPPVIGIAQVALQVCPLARESFARRQRECRIVVGDCALDVVRAFAFCPLGEGHPQILLDRPPFGQCPAGREKT